MPSPTVAFLKIGKKRSVTATTTKERLAREHAVGNLVKIRERAMRNLFDEVRTLRDLEEIFSSKELQDDRDDNLEIPAMLFEPKREVEEKAEAKEKSAKTNKATSSKTQKKLKNK